MNEKLKRRLPELTDKFWEDLSVFENYNNDKHDIHLILKDFYAIYQDEQQRNANYRNIFFGKMQEKWQPEANFYFLKEEYTGFFKILVFESKHYNGTQTKIIELINLLIQYSDFKIVDTELVRGLLEYYAITEDKKILERFDIKEIYPGILDGSFITNYYINNDHDPRSLKLQRLKKFNELGLKNFPNIVNLYKLIKYHILCDENYDKDEAKAIIELLKNNKQSFNELDSIIELNKILRFPSFKFYNFILEIVDESNSKKNLVFSILRFYKFQIDVENPILNHIDLSFSALSNIEEIICILCSLYFEEKPREKIKELIKTPISKKNYDGLFNGIRRLLTVNERNLSHEKAKIDFLIYLLREQYRNQKDYRKEYLEKITNRQIFSSLIKYVPIGSPSDIYLFNSIFSFMYSIRDLSNVWYSDTLLESLVFCLDWYKDITDVSQCLDLILEIKNDQYSKALLLILLKYKSQDPKIICNILEPIVNNPNFGELFMLESYQIVFGFVKNGDIGVYNIAKTLCKSIHNCDSFIQAMAVLMNPFDIEKYLILLNEALVNNNGLKISMEYDPQFIFKYFNYGMNSSTFLLVIKIISRYLKEPKIIELFCALLKENSPVLMTKECADVINESTELEFFSYPDLYVYFIPHLSKLFIDNKMFGVSFDNIIVIYELSFMEDEACDGLNKSVIECLCSVFTISTISTKNCRRLIQVVSFTNKLKFAQLISVLWNHFLEKFPDQMYGALEKFDYCCAFVEMASKKNKDLVKQSLRYIHSIAVSFMKKNKDEISNSLQKAIYYIILGFGSPQYYDGVLEYFVSFCFSNPPEFFCEYIPLICFLKPVCNENIFINVYEQLRSFLSLNSFSENMKWLYLINCRTGFSNESIMFPQRLCLTKKFKLSKVNEIIGQYQNKIMIFLNKLGRIRGNITNEFRISKFVSPSGIRNRFKDKKKNMENSLVLYPRKEDIRIDCERKTLISHQIGSIFIFDKGIDFFSNKQINLFTNEPSEYNRKIEIFFSKANFYIPRMCDGKYAIEIFTNSKSYYFIFSNETGFLDVKNSLQGKISPFSMEKKINEWIGREISNYEYLYYINIYIGRSYNDFLAYPMFPCVSDDYISIVENMNKAGSLYMKNPAAYYLKSLQPFLSIEMLSNSRLCSNNGNSNSFFKGWELIPEQFVLPQFLPSFKDLNIQNNIIPGEKHFEILLKNRISLESSFFNEKINEFIEYLKKDSPFKYPDLSLFEKVQRNKEPIYSKNSTINTQRSVVGLHWSNKIQSLEKSGKEIPSFMNKIAYIDQQWLFISDEFVLKSSNMSFDQTIKASSMASWGNKLVVGFVDPIRIGIIESEKNKSHISIVFKETRGNIITITVSVHLRIIACVDSLKNVLIIDLDSHKLITLFQIMNIPLKIFISEIGYIIIISHNNTDTIIEYFNIYGFALLDKRINGLADCAMFCHNTDFKDYIAIALSNSIIIYEAINIVEIKQFQIEEKIVAFEYERHSKTLYCAPENRLKIFKYILNF